MLRGRAKHRGSSIRPESGNPAHPKGAGLVLTREDLVAGVGMVSTGREILDNEAIVAHGQPGVETANYAFHDPSTDGWVRCTRCPWKLSSMSPWRSGRRFSGWTSGQSWTTLSAPRLPPST
jgi:hypothetical protein